ncbi:MULTISPECIES: DUF4136 domain-containing protein [Flavobacterium]|jgi:hypothetical protein|uniref:DUF4136 domain-containing protein n=1 Tax=Flavobacterium jumunjinense TaxID=998845 RepID=A0ABV5GSA6_9FLAO|nr:MULTISPECIES: DUF4136 domain-containing protein [Flavobacterium]
MKKINLIPVLLLFVLASCSSVRVNADYDKKAEFGKYKTYAYLKSSIDKAEISDLDKKRILRSIDEEMSAKGFSKSENPDMLLSIFTKERERIDVYNNVGFGWGWNPYWGMNSSSVSRTPEGTLFIDIVDAKTKEMVWQGEGTGYLTKNTHKKDERTHQFVSKILEQYPPVIK